MNELETRLTLLLERKAAVADVAPIEGFDKDPSAVAPSRVIELRPAGHRPGPWRTLAVAAAMVTAVVGTALFAAATDTASDTTPGTVAEEAVPPTGPAPSALPARAPSEIEAGVPQLLTPADASTIFDHWKDQFTNDGSTRFLHRVRGFATGSLHWIVADYTEPSLRGIEQGVMLMTPEGDVTGNVTNPVCCSQAGSSRWVLFHDLQSDVAYVTFDGGTRWQRPVDGVAIVPTSDVRFYDRDGRALDPRLPEPAQIDLAGGIGSAGTSDEMFSSTMAKCLSDRGVDMFATDDTAAQRWTACLAEARAAADRAGASTGSSSSP